MLNFLRNTKDEVNFQNVKNGAEIPLILAPMAGLTHVAFRQLVAELGGCSVFYTEMLNSRKVANRSIKDDIYLKKGAIDTPLVAQLVGNDPPTMVKAALLLKEQGFNGIDINMGCSKKAITRHGWGAALLSMPRLAFDLVREVRKAVSGLLSVKLRSMESHHRRKLIEFCKGLEENGADLIILHPRSPRDGFKRPAVWHEIKDVSEALDIPVVGNGDIASPEDILRMKQETGCLGVMIGRAAMVRPWIFQEAVMGRKWQGNIMDIIERAAFLYRYYLPKPAQTRRFIDFGNWITRNWTFHHYLTKGLSRLQTIAECLDFLRQGLGDGANSMVKRPFVGKL